MDITRYFPSTFLLLEIPTIEPSEPWKQHLASLAGFDQETLRSLAEAFVSEVPQLCQSLRQAIDAEDPRAAIRIAHSLRSSFRCVDPSGQAESIAQQVEIAAGQSRFEEASQWLPALQRTADQWCQRVATMIPAEKRHTQSLCESCELRREVRSGTGSIFTLCRHGLTDRDWPKYPPQPMRQCPYFQPLDLTSGEPPAADSD